MGRVCVPCPQKSRMRKRKLCREGEKWKESEHSSSVGTLTSSELGKQKPEHLQRLKEAEVLLYYLGWGLSEYIKIAQGKFLQSLL